jgi:hypothetical protein
VVDLEEAGRLRLEAKAALERSCRIYEKQGKVSQELMARTLLESIDQQMDSFQ